MHLWYAKWKWSAQWLLVIVSLTLVGVGTLTVPPINVRAAIAPTVLGTAQSFAVLGGSTVTNTGPTVITGANLGVSPGSAITGFPPGIVTAPGTIHATDAVAAQAQSDVTTAYNVLAGQSCRTNLATELGGLTLTPGVYCQATAGLTGTLTLDAQGNPNAVFVFKAASTLITASNASIRMINGGSPCNVYWQVGSSATLGTNTAFVGNILALTSVTVTTGATVAGRALARNGAVTLDSNRFTPSACTTAPINTPTNTPTNGPPTTAPPSGRNSTATPVSSAPAGPGIETPVSIPAPSIPVPRAGATETPSATVVAGTPITIPGTGTPPATLAAGTPVNAIPTATPARETPSSGTPISGTPTFAFFVTPTPVVTRATGTPITTVTTGTPTSSLATGTPATGTPVSVTLPLVGTVPIPVAMSNTGGGGMATHFTTPTDGVGDSRTTPLLWMSILVALLALASTGLLFFTRKRR